MNSNFNKFQNLLMKYFTARIDIKNTGNVQNNIFIISLDDLSAKINYPSWFENHDGKGMVIQSDSGVMDFELKCVNDGILKIWLRGIDYRDKNDNRFPIYIIYTNFSINDTEILKENKVVSHDDFYLFEQKVEDSEIIKIHIEWVHFNENSEFQNSILSLQEKLKNIEKHVDNIPQLCGSSVGTTTLDGKIIYRNWKGYTYPKCTLMDDFDGFCEDIWFTHYLKHKFPDADYKINFFGPFGRHYNLKEEMEGKKVFYSGEDLNMRFLEMKNEFDRYALDYVDLAMGYDFVENQKYLRFPNWFRWEFDVDVTAEDIERTVDEWNSLNYAKKEDVLNVSSHDMWNVRSIIADNIEEFTDIKYAGKWRNNTRDLWDKYDDDKREYSKQFKFNLCAENLFDDAYVTEKIFECIRCDCIPLYAGGGNYLEPEVLNPKVILRWYEDDDSANEDTVELFKNLLTDEKSYKEFKEQPPLLESSKKYIINKFAQFEKHFERLIYG